MRRYRTGSSLGEGSQWLAIGDLNGDGAHDVVTANSYPSFSVTLLLNRGDGRFLPRLDYRAGQFDPVSVAAADLNRDRRLDIVTADDGGTVSVFLNRPGLCDVQFVKGLRLADAKQKLARAHCRVGSVRRAYSDLPKGRVFGQSPKFAAVLPGGSKVDLRVSLGRKR